MPDSFVSSWLKSSAVGRDDFRCDFAPTNECYGEPTGQGMRNLLKSWPTKGLCALDDDSEILDVGSGTGRFASYLRLATNVSRVRGIEINECRHTRAIGLLATLREQADAAGEPLGDFDLTHGDVLVDGLGDATHVFVACQCFTEKLMRGFMEQVRASSRLRCMVLFAGWGEEYHFAPADEYDLWGGVTKMRSVATTYFGATALWVAKGPCGDKSEKDCPADAPPSPSPSPPSPRPPCKPFMEAVGEAKTSLLEWMTSDESMASTKANEYAHY